MQSDNNTIGILKQLTDETSTDLTKAWRTKEDVKANHAVFVAAHGEEISRLTVKIETKQSWQSDLGVDVESMKCDLAEPKRTLAARRS